MSWQELFSFHMMYSPLIRMFKKDCLNTISLIFAALTVFDGTSGQTVSVSIPAWAPEGKIKLGDSIPLTCTVTGGPVTPNNIQWIDGSQEGLAVTLFNGESRFSQDPKYSNFNVTSLSGTESVMTIHSADAGDDGDYSCAIPSDTTTSSIVNIDVQAPGNATTNISSSVNDDGEDMYEATCDVVGSKPQVDIIWILNGVTQTDGSGNTIVQTHPTATPPLSNTRSVFTFPATPENHGWTLICQATGYELPDIDLQKSIVLDIHSSPDTAGTTVTADYATQGSDIIVKCTPKNEPTPEMRNYFIFSNGTLIHESMNSVKDYTVSNPVVGTNYTCIAGNYLGNTSLSEPVTYDPTRTTTPPTAPITTEGVTTTTAPDTTEPVVGGPTPNPTGMPTDSPLTTNSSEGGPGEDPKEAGLSGGEIAGIVVGAIIFITIIIVLIVIFVVKPDCIGGSGSPNTTTTHKHSTSAVGSSNGNEKNDVELEAPLNGVNEVITQEKIRPEAAPRGHSSIKHTTDNPQQAEYAMVDRRPGGRGDSTDARGNGAGQNEQPGMHYADLDLTSSAGHSDRVVPKNEDGVVVYSSILV